MLICFPETQAERSVSSNTSSLAETGRGNILNCILLKLSPESNRHVILLANTSHITMPNLTEGREV